MSDKELVNTLITFLTTCNVSGKGGGIHTRRQSGKQKGGTPLCNEIAPHASGWKQLPQEIKDIIFQEFTQRDFKENYLLAHIYAQDLGSIMHTADTMTILQTVCKYHKEFSMQVSKSLIIICNKDDIQGNIQFNMIIDVEKSFTDEKSKQSLQRGMEKKQNLLNIISSFQAANKNILVKEKIRSDIKTLQSFLDEEKTHVPCVVQIDATIESTNITSTCISQGNPNFSDLGQILYDAQIEDRYIQPKYETMTFHGLEELYIYINEQLQLIGLIPVEFATMFKWTDASKFGYSRYAGRNYMYLEDDVFNVISQIHATKNIILNRVFKNIPNGASRTIGTAYVQGAPMDVTHQPILPKADYFTREEIIKMSETLKPAELIECIQEKLTPLKAPSIEELVKVRREQLRKQQGQQEGQGGGHGLPIRTDERITIGKRNCIVYKGKRNSKFIKKNGQYINIKKLKS